MELSKRTLRQMKNLSQVCEFDMEKKVALMHLHYKTPDDLIDEHLSRPGIPVVSDDAVDYLCKLISDIPKEFTVDFALTVDDYGEYDHDSLLHSLRATVENTFYYYDEDRKRNNVLAVIFMIIGIVMLATVTVGGIADWFGKGDSITKGIVETLLDVMVWVFIWEGAAILFLTYENDSTVFGSQMQRFYGIRFLNTEGKELGSLTDEQFYQDWIFINSKEVFARNFILFSNASLLALLSIVTVEFFAKIGDVYNVQKLVFVARWIMTILLVWSNISFFSEKGKMKDYALALSVIVLVFRVFGGVYAYINWSVTSKYFIWDLILSLDLIINIICLSYMRKQNINIGA